MHTRVVIIRWLSRFCVFAALLLILLWIRSFNARDIVFLHLCRYGSAPWHEWTLQMDSRGGRAMLGLVHETLSDKYQFRDSSHVVLRPDPMRAQLDPFYSYLNDAAFDSWTETSDSHYTVSVRFPYWFAILLGLLPVSLCFVVPVRAWLWRIRTSHVELRCPQCGYDLRASTDRCPECGRAFDRDDPDTLRLHPRWHDICCWFRRWLRCFLILAIIVAIPPVAGFFWIRHGWSTEQPHLAAIRQRNDCTVVVAPLDAWYTRLLPSDVAYVAERADRISFYRANIIAHADVQHLRAFKSLRALDLHVTIPKEGLPWLAEMTHVKALRLTATETTDEHLRYLSNLTRLHELRLNRLMITDMGVRHLGGLTNLRILDLETTLVADNGLAHLRSLSNLESLNLTYTRVTDNGLQHLASLVRLKRLSLRWTDINGEGLRHLNGMTELRTLELTGTHVSDEGLRHLRNLRGLEVLKLGGCRDITVEGVRQLQSALPKLRIDIDERQP